MGKCKWCFDLAATANAMEMSPLPFMGKINHKSERYAFFALYSEHRENFHYSESSANSRWLRWKSETAIRWKIVQKLIPNESHLIRIVLKTIEIERCFFRCLPKKLKAIHQSHSHIRLKRLRFIGWHFTDSPLPASLHTLKRASVAKWMDRALAKN